MGNRHTKMSEKCILRGVEMCLSRLCFEWDDPYIPYNTHVDIRVKLQDIFTHICLRENVADTYIPVVT